MAFDHPKIFALATACALLAGCSTMPVGNPSVPEPTKAVDLKAYSGLWYEMGRYENRFETNCEGVTAEYTPLSDGSVQVINTCHQASPTGPVKVSKGNAKLVQNANGAKLKVSFFGPLYFGNYWILDHADDYSWSIVGEPSGKYLWLLTRQANPAPADKALIEARAHQLGYNVDLLHATHH